MIEELENKLYQIDPIFFDNAWFMSHIPEEIIVSLNNLLYEFYKQIQGL